MDCSARILYATRKKTHWNGFSRYSQNEDFLFKRSYGAQLTHDHDLRDYTWTCSYNDQAFNELLGIQHRNIQLM